MVDRLVVFLRCTDDPKATYANWRDMLRAACSQDFSRPLDIIQAVGKLNAAIGMLSASGDGGSPSSESNQKKKKKKKKKKKNMTFDVDLAIDSFPLP
jgi:hypothetical protein